MAISVGFTRPLATVTGTETESVTWELTEDDTNNQIILERTATVNSAVRIFQRIYLQETFSGTSLVLKIKSVQFQGDETYVSATNPADSAGVVALAEITLPPQDLDAFHTTAGDARS